MAERMATWVVWAVINSHRRMEDFRATQATKEWPELDVPDNADTTVLVLGSGVMGRAAAEAVSQLGAPCLHFLTPVLLLVLFLPHGSQQHVPSEQGSDCAVGQCGGVRARARLWRHVQDCR